MNVRPDSNRAIVVANLAVLPRCANTDTRITRVV